MFLAKTETYRLTQINPDHIELHDRKDGSYVIVNACKLHFEDGVTLYFRNGTWSTSNRSRQRYGEVDLDARLASAQL